MLFWISIGLLFIGQNFALPSNSDMVWMPNLRGLPLRRNGEIVAEFEVNLAQRIKRNTLSNPLRVQTK